MAPENDIKNKNYLIKYSVGWSLFLVFLILNKLFFNIEIINDLVKGKLGFILFGIYAIIIAIEGNRLNSYLLKHHHKEWIKTEYFMGQGKQEADPFDRLYFFIGDEDFNDPEVARLKKQLRLFLLFSVVVFFSYSFCASLY